MERRDHKNIHFLAEETIALFHILIGTRIKKKCRPIKRKEKKTPVFTNTANNSTN